MEDRPTLRLLSAEDLDEVLGIEEVSFEFPWTRDEFLGYLRQSHICFVAVQAGQIVGYTLYTAGRSQLSIARFAVCPCYRRQGVGRRMAQRLVDKLHWQTRKEVVLCTHEENLPSQLFWRACGFRAVNILRDYYKDGKSAYCMSYSCCPMRR